MECGFALLAFVLAWFVAQIWKIIGGWIKGGAGKKVSFEELIGYCFRSGGMPSGHTASLTALVTYLGCTEGLGSGIFALAVGIWLIVIYDAIHVRYAVGEQGKALNELLKAAGKPGMPVVEGHTVAQVIVGAIIGVIIGIILWAGCSNGFLY